MSGRKRQVHQLNRQTIIFAILAVILFLSFRWYQDYASTVTITFTNSNGETTSPLKVKIADDNPSIKKGLMFVKEMPRDEGMLFVFPREEVQSFWMKNTFISLDMLFIGADMKVVGILHDVPPMNEKSRTVSKPSRFVLELNAGVARSLGIDRGSIMNVPPEVIRKAE